MSEKETVPCAVAYPGLSQPHLLAFFCSSFKFPLSQKLTIRSSISVRNIELLSNFCQTAKSLRKLTTNCRGEWLNLGPPGPASVARGRIFGTGGTGRPGEEGGGRMGGMGTGRLTITSKPPSPGSVSLHSLAAAKTQL